MRITIDTDALLKENIPLGDFLILLLGYMNISAKGALQDLLDVRKIGKKDWRDEYSLVLSDKERDFVAKILIESDEKLKQSPVKDFDALAEKLMSLYPEGNKGGTTYPWRGTKEEIAQKLRVLVVKYNFIYTEQEAINAVKTYVHGFQETKDYKYMKLLKYFLLRTKNGEITSDFMSIIENSKDEDS